MRSVLILALAMAFYGACVNCGDSSGTNNCDKIKEEVQQIKLNQQSYQKQLQQFQELISTLIAELKNKNEQQQQPQFNWRSADYQWVSWSVRQPIPQGAVFVGYHWNKKELYVGRVRHNGDDYVAKVSPKDRKCYLAYGGKETHFTECEVLTGSGFSWVFSSNGNLPANAFPCGTKANGQPQLIGRVDHPWKTTRISRTPGTIDISDGILSIPYEREEFRYSNYDVLVVN